MDPNHWNALSQHYGRVQAPLSSQGRLDIPLLEQASPGTLAASAGALGQGSGLGVTVPTPVVAHANPAGRIGMNYSPIVSQYDSQPSYRSTVDQVRLNEQARYATAVALAKSSMFNTDPHTMKEPSPVHSGSQLGHSLHGLSESNPYASAALLQEPPPAHSGSHRPATLQRSSYEQGQVAPEPRQQSSFTSVSRHKETQPAPPTAHSNTSSSRYETYHGHQQSQPRSCQQETRHYQEASHTLSQPTYIDSPLSTISSLSSQRSYRDSPQHQTQQTYQHPAQPTLQGHQKKSSEAQFSSFSQVVSSPSFNSNLLSTLERASAESLLSNSSQLESVTLQDLAALSSTQPKLLHNTNISSYAPTQHAQVVVQQVSVPQMKVPSPISSPKIHSAPSTASSFLDTSISNIKSVKIPPPVMSPTSVLTSAHGMAALPVQAMADSTTITKPKKKRVRSKKKTASPDRFETSSASHTAFNPVIEEKLAVQSISGDAMSHLGGLETGMTFETVDPSILGLGTSGVTTYQSIPLAGRVSVETEPIFMTNSCGNAFVNPNDILNTNLPEMDTCLVNGLPQYEGEEDDRRYRSKAGQSYMQEEEDEEFAHLASGASVPCSSIGKSEDGKSMPPEQPPAPAAAGNKSNSGFQSSFLSFIQGKKQETLSSVTNQSISKRPPMPKYIPDTRPIRRPEPPPKRKEDSPAKVPSVVRKATATATLSNPDGDRNYAPRTSVNKNTKRAKVPVPKPPIKLTIPKAAIIPPEPRTLPRRAASLKRRKPNYYDDDDSPIEDEIVLSDEDDDDDEKDADWKVDEDDDDDEMGQ